ncbi:uncharacterized protein LOC126822620 isoform X2 [Patella vulgata]|nr:uncharacterized protein LOC126822620 isoform X2 [Patella vulgata]
MHENDRWKIQKHIRLLLSIDPKELIIELHSLFVFDDDEFEHLLEYLESRGRRECMLKLLVKLYRKGKNSYVNFLVALERCNFTGIIKTLEPGSGIYEGRFKYSGHRFFELIDNTSPKYKEFAKRCEKIIEDLYLDQPKLFVVVKKVAKGCVEVTFHLISLDSNNEEDLRRPLQDMVNSGFIGTDPVKAERFYFSQITDEELTSERESMIQRRIIVLENEIETLQLQIHELLIENTALKTTSANSQEMEKYQEYLAKKYTDKLQDKELIICRLQEQLDQQATYSNVDMDRTDDERLDQDKPLILLPIDDDLNKDQVNHGEDISAKQQTERRLVPGKKDKTNKTSVEEMESGTDKVFTLDLMDKTNVQRDGRTCKRKSSNESDVEMEHLIPTKIAKLSVESESEDIKQKHEIQKIQDRLSQAVNDINIDLMETILKELQPDDVRRLQDVIISLTCQSLERRYLSLVKCLFNNIIILQSDGQLDINLNIQLMTCAIKSDFVEGIQYLYSKKLYLQVEHDDKVWNALLESVKYNSFNITKYLLTVSDLNLNPDSDKTILMFAKSGQMLSILLSNDQIKNMINYKSKYGYTALFYCIKNTDNVAECLNCTNILTEAGAEFDKFNLNKSLEYVIYKYGDTNTCLDIILLLIQHGADLNMVGELGRSPLTCAIIRHGDKDTSLGIITLLLQHGADLNMVDGFGRSPLTCAIIRHGDTDTSLGIITLLLQHGADLNMVVGGHSPLTCAIYHHGDKETCVGIITLLIQHGADPTQSVNTTTPLMYASQYAHYIDIVKLVLVDIVNVNRTNDHGLSACRHCFVKTVKSKRYFKTTLAIFKLLVESGANLVADGPELLYDIMKFGQLNIFEYYIGLKPLVNSFTETTNRNIFHLLAQVKYEFTPEKFNWLFNSNIDINHKDSLTNTPLIIGAFLLNHKYLDLITKYGPTCDVNIQNNKGHTAIHSAVIGCLISKSKLKQTGNSMDDSLSEQYETFQECVKLLLETGGNINSQDNNGKTALILAAKKNNKFIIQLLLELGSNINILETKYNTSALQFLDLDYGRHCLKTCLIRGGHKLLNLPGPDGNTLIQRALLFPTCSDPEKTVDVIKYLVAENCCLQHLQSVSTERNYYNDDVHLQDFDSKERNKLRQLLYRSGAPEEEIVSTVNFKMEDEQDRRTRMFHSAQDGREEMFHSENREEFKFACFNLSLEEKCIRVIRQKLGLEIKEKVEQLQLANSLAKKILLVDLLPKKYFIRYSMDDYLDEDNIMEDDDGDDDDDDDDDDDNDDSDNDFDDCDYQGYNLK